MLNRALVHLGIPKCFRLFLVGGDWNRTLIFPYIGTNHPTWLIFFRGIETTNQVFNRKFDDETKITKHGVWRFFRHDQMALTCAHIFQTHALWMQDVGEYALALLRSSKLWCLPKKDAVGSSTHIMFDIRISYRAMVKLSRLCVFFVWVLFWITTLLFLILSDFSPFADPSGGLVTMAGDGANQQCATSLGTHWGLPQKS